MFADSDSDLSLVDSSDSDIEVVTPREMDVEAEDDEHPSDDDEVAIAVAEVLPYEEQLELALNRYPAYRSVDVILGCFPDMDDCFKDPDMFLQFVFRVGKFIRQECGIREGGMHAWTTSFRPVILQAVLQLEALTDEYRKWYCDYMTKLARFVESCPSEPRDLLAEHRHSLEEQRRQFDEQFADWSKNGAKTSPPTPDRAMNDTKEKGTDQAMPCKRPPTILQDDRTSFTNSGTVRLAKDDPEIESLIATLPPDLFAVTPSGIEHLKLANPLPVASSECGYVCDMCNRKNVVVAYQVIRDDRETTDRALNMVYENCVGFDVCVACVLYYVWEHRSAIERLSQSPPPIGNVGTVAMTQRYCSIQVERIQADSVTGHVFAVAVAPVGATIAIFPFQQQGEGGMSIETVLQSDQRLQPLAITKSNATAVEDDDVCAICLDRLTEGEVIQTSCHHWFHKGCMLDHCEHNSLLGLQTCPMCRKEMPRRLPDDAAAVLAENKFRVTLSAEDVAQHSTLLFAALLRPQYRYWTDVAAIALVDVRVK